MVGMDFETTVRENIPIIAVLISNGVMGGYGKKHLIATEKYGVDCLSGDNTGVVEALGGYNERVSVVSDLALAIERSLRSDREGRAGMVEVKVAENFEYSGS